MKVVYVKWIDPASEDAWIDRKDVDMDYYLVESVGILVKETKNVLAIAVNVCAVNERTSCVMMIPKKCIMKRKDMSIDKIR